MYPCEKCIFDKNDKSVYLECRENPVVQRILMTLPKRSYFMEYEPVCPRGYCDCVYDPAYIKYYHPEWYKKLYGDMTPKEAIYVENGCHERMEQDPDEIYYCYDDEDK